MSMADKILGEKYIKLSDGSLIREHRSDRPLYFILVIIAFAISLKLTDFNPSLLWQRIHQAGFIIFNILNPNWEYLPLVINLLLETILMSVVGTIIGALLAFPMAILSSNNINKNKFILWVCRFILSIIRSFPTIILANICALIFSLGTFAGTISISIFTFGIVSKMLIESIETLDMKAFEACQAMGAGKLKSFYVACIPQIINTYISQALYSFEINVRSAAILGYVGAGGIGIMIAQRIGWRDYNGLGMIIISLFVVVLIINAFNKFLRNKML